MIWTPDASREFERWISSAPYGNRIAGHFLDGVVLLNVERGCEHVRMWVRPPFMVRRADGAVRLVDWDGEDGGVSIRVRARLHRWRSPDDGALITRGPSQSAFVRGFIDGSPRGSSRAACARSLNPRSCAASSMAGEGGYYPVIDLCVSIRVRARLHRWRANPPDWSSGTSRSQSAFVRGFIDGSTRGMSRTTPSSQSAFVRGFIDGDVSPTQKFGPV